ncbi:hypothetical protein, partial [Viscerimonas tarda]
LLAFIACLTVEAQESLLSPPENALPSEMAAQNITELTSGETTAKPGLRYGPAGEEGEGANKETKQQNATVCEIDFAIIIAMGLSGLVYTFFKLRKVNRNYRKYEKI